MRAIAVLNRDGGTLRTMDLDAFCQLAVDRFAARGHALDCRIVKGKEVEQTLRDAARSDTELIIAGGGDGTISTAAAIAFEYDKPLGVLPAGTMNLFARALGMPTDLQAALEAIAGGKMDRIDIATANGRPFVHQYGVGIHARLVRIRNQMTYRSRIGKMAASLRAISSAVLNPPRFTVDLAASDLDDERVVSGIVVSNNRLEDGPIPVAETLHGGVLGVYLAVSMGTGELLGLFFDVFTGRWRANDFVSEIEVPELTLQFPKRKRGGHAVVDGELVALEDHVVLRVHKAGLAVVRPQGAQS